MYVTCRLYVKYFYECGSLLFFFFKQKTAYEMLRSLVGSEMCIRDRYWHYRSVSSTDDTPPQRGPPWRRQGYEGHPQHIGIVAVCTGSWHPLYPDRLAACPITHYQPCLLYTSDAADEEDSADLGCRRII
eukprot:TRINITY_DN47157_c0_g1_i1.p1 TRINITY_DN47157_c0_g1~~TRINITY_DN47157_c0_g1_i1.p1  ORF type:complete len:130 (+),score=16.10 TRINITY_DN47157_c0_g1_i1:17-406(+)